MAKDDGKHFLVMEPWIAHYISQSIMGYIKRNNWGSAILT